MTQYPILLEKRREKQTKNYLDGWNWWNDGRNIAKRIGETEKTSNAR